MKTFRVTLQGKDGKLVYISLQAKNAEEAERLAGEAQYRRQERFPLTFARLEQAAATGEAYLPEQVYPVVETQLTYLRAIGAVGPAVDTDEAGDEG